MHAIAFSVFFHPHSRLGKAISRTFCVRCVRVEVVRDGVGAVVPSSPPKFQKIQKVHESPPHRHQRIRYDSLITIPSRSARNSVISVTFGHTDFQWKLRDVSPPTVRPPKTESDEKVLLRPRNRFHRIQHKKLCTETSLDVRITASLSRFEFSGPWREAASPVGP